MTAKPIQTVEPDSTAKKKRGKERPKPKNWLHALWLNWIKPIGLAVLVVFAFRWTIADWNDVPSPSMEPTILTGDRIFVNKLAFHLKFPFTHWKIAQWGEPNRGDIVVFFAHQTRDGGPLFIIDSLDQASRRLILTPTASSSLGELEPGMKIKIYDPASPTPNDRYVMRVDSVDAAAGRATITVDTSLEGVEPGWMLGESEYRRLVKRVVAIGGDTIEVRRNVVHINGQALEYEPAGDEVMRLDFDFMLEEISRSQFLRETINSTRHFVMLMPNAIDRYVNYGPHTVPDGHCFMMGDNRNRSRDCRDTAIGFIPLDQITGRAFGVAFSFDRNPSWRVRWDRFFAGFMEEEVAE